MTIKTNLSWNTLARYSAMLWNNGKDEYIANGDTLVEMIEEDGDEDFVLTVDYLQDDCKWHIQSYFEMLEEDFIATCHDDYLRGRRDKETVDGHNEYLKQRKILNTFKRDFRKWLQSVEEVEVWEYDTDNVEFISFPSSANGQAVAILH